MAYFGSSAYTVPLQGAYVVPLGDNLYSPVAGYYTPQTTQMVSLTPQSSTTRTTVLPSQRAVVTDQYGQQYAVERRTRVVETFPSSQTAFYGGSNSHGGSQTSYGGSNSYSGSNTSTSVSASSQSTSGSAGSSGVTVNVNVTVGGSAGSGSGSSQMTPAQMMNHLAGLRDAGYRNGGGSVPRYGW